MSPNSLKVLALSEVITITVSVNFIAILMASNNSSASSPTLLYVNNESSVGVGCGNNMVKIHCEP